MALEDARTEVDSAFTRKGQRGLSFENAFGGATSFLRRSYTKDLTGVDLAITGVPFDQAVTHRTGTRFGPRAIREASTLQPYDPPFGWPTNPLEDLNIVDYGDVAFDHGRPAEIPGIIEDTARRILATDTALLSLGGDHFIAYPLLRAHVEKHGPLSLVHFDAHSDTWGEDGEDGRVDHGTMFYHATREGLVDPARSVQIGLRTTNDDPLGFNIIDARQACSQSAADIARQIHTIVGKNKVYLTFDIDCLDPAFAPGTGTPVCGGLSPRQALDILWGMRGLQVVGADLVEVAPAYDIAEITALAGAHLALEFICLMAHWKREHPSA